ncbi:hypothetical protein ACOZ32_05020 [Halobacterium sp. MBLA0001]|uniref:hypothetical protein n=1 Tax=Halobacterium sp. MBLA0001 TaxID=3413511 RepID=UPI003C74C968
MGSNARHPVLVDTDALIAVANTELWPAITETLTLTTTNVCLQELTHHIRETSEYAADGTQDNWVYEGSKAARQPFEDESNGAFTVVPCVPRPHGEDAGEESLRREIVQHPDEYTHAILMDKHGRIALNRAFESAETAGQAVAPPFLLYLLYDADACTKAEFCRACGELLEGEGWTGYQAVEAAWNAIPINCSEFLPDDLLPDE